MKEILPGIFQMTLTLPGFNPGSVNTYLIKSKDGYTSIDTGWDSPPSVESREQQLAEIGAHISDITQVIITHCHIDHFGMIARFKRSQHTKIYLHENEIGLIKIRFSEVDNFIPMTDKFLISHGVPESELPPPEIQLPLNEDLSKAAPDVLLKGGEMLSVGEYDLKVINAPGHTPGHIVLYEPKKKFLFSGDTLLPTIDTNAAIHVQYIQFPLQQYLNSLLSLKELDINLILPGHEYVFSGHKQRIEEIFRHHQKKSDEILRAFADKLPKTAYEVSRILAWSPKTKANVWNNLTGWDKRFAVLQSIAHLESLRFKQKLESDTINGIHHYRLADQ
jgi:glyoxylase-like metal-dependent hydrolase (beta-lactamase superfamily II)